MKNLIRSIGDWFDNHIVAPMNDFARKHPDGLWWVSVITPSVSIIISLILIFVLVRRLG